MRSWPDVSTGRRTRPTFWTSLQDAVDEIESGEVALPLAGIAGALDEAEVVQGVSAGTDGQTLRWRHGAPAYVRSRELYLNDRNDIDATGASDMGATISAYLSEFASDNLRMVYCEPESTYTTSTTIALPGHMTIDGGMRGYIADTDHLTTFEATSGCTQVFALDADYSTLRGICVDPKSIATVGIGMDTSVSPRIEFCQVNAPPAGGAAIRGGGLENIAIEHSVIYSGATGFGIDLQEGYSTAGSVYYGADNRSNIQGNDLIGGGTKLRVSGQCRVRDNDIEGGMTIASGYHVVLGEQVGTATTFIRFEGNYTEFQGRSGAGASAIPIGVYIAPSGGWYSVTGNMFYGNTSYQSISGSAAVKIANYTDGHFVHDNAFRRWDIGIDTPASAIATSTAGLSALTPNVFAAANVNTPIANVSPRTLGNLIGNPAVLATIGRHTFTTGALSGGLYYGGATNPTPTDVDWSRANVHVVGDVSATLVPANHTYGQTVILVFDGGLATLPTASWGLRSAADETPVSGTVKAFVVDHDGDVREVSSSIPKLAALTAANAGTINSGDGTTDTVIGNMRTRIAELEDALQAIGVVS